MIRKTTFIALITVFVSAIFWGSCKKEDPVDQDAVDHQLIADYIAQNNLDGQFTESGLYYVIGDSGTVNHPQWNSVVTVSYHGYYLDGTTLDQHDYYTERLNLLIQGWQEGIPLIGEGGQIKLIIPSRLAYGSNPPGGVRPNAVLVFDIKLHNFTAGKK